MEALNLEPYIKTYSLSFDEPHMGSSFNKGDQILVEETNHPKPGLVLVLTPSGIRLCRYETPNGKESIFPPHLPLNEDIKPFILGQVVDHIRLSKWVNFSD